MGTILTGYGDASYDHEGYAAQVLDDGTLTGTYSAQTAPRMIGQLVAVCDCGWTGAVCYPTTAGLCDERAEGFALGEWELTHARPVLERERTGRGARLRELLGWAEARCAQLEVSGPAQYRDHLDSLVTALAEATALAGDLREQATRAVERPGKSR